MVLRSDGRLFNVRLAPDNDLLNKDITEQAICYLYSNLELDPDVTLRDIFLLLNSNLELYSVIFGNWLEDYVKEGLSEPTNSSNINLKRLELKYYIVNDNFGLSGSLIPELHGFGLDGAGKEILIGVETIQANLLASLPLSLKKNGVVSEITETEEEVEILKYDNILFTLGGVLHAINTALSTFGSPAQRDAFLEMLHERIENSGLADENELKELSKDFDV